MGTVIGGLLIPKFKSADLGLAELQGIQGANQMIQGQTRLAELTEFERAQQAAQAAREFHMRHPQESLYGWQPQAPQSILGGAGLPQAPMMQQTFGGGMPPGAPQVVPEGQDLSQFATQGAPGQSTIGQPRAGQGPPQDPMVELMARDPDAARIVQERMMKMQEGNLKREIQKFEYVARILQGVTDQASLQDAHKEIGRAYPDLVGKLPQQYSKEALAPLIARAFEVKERAALGLQEINARTNAGELALKERQLAGTIPEYVKGAPDLNAHIDALMKRAGLPPGSTVPPEITEQAQQNVLEGKTVVSAAQGSGQVFETRDGTKMRLRPGTNIVEPLYMPGGEPLQGKPTQAEQTTATFANLARKGHESAVALEEKGFQPGFWEKNFDKLPFDIGNYLTSEDYQKYKDYVTDFAQAWLRETSKGAVTQPEWDMVNRRYFPQPGNTKEQIETKRRAREQVIKELEDVGRGTGRMAPPASPRKSVSELSIEDTKAEIEALKRRSK